MMQLQKKVGLCILLGTALGLTGCGSPTMATGGTLSTSHLGASQQTQPISDGKQTLPVQTVGTVPNPSRTNQSAVPGTPATFPPKPPNTPTDTPTQPKINSPAPTGLPAFTAVLQDGTAWAQTPSSNISPWIIYYTSGADSAHLSNGARVVATLPLRDKTGGLLSLIRITAAGQWIVYEYSDWPDKTGAPLYTAIDAVNVSSGKIIPIWQGPIGQTAHLTYSVAPGSVVYETGTTGAKAIQVDSCNLLNLDTQKTTSVHLPNWTELGWNGSLYTAESNGAQFGIDPTTGHLITLGLNTVLAYKEILNTLRSTVNIPMVLPLNPPVPLKGQYYYTQYEALPSSYSVALFSSAQAMIPNAPTSYGDTTFLGSIRAAAGEGTLTAEGQIPSLLATAVSIDNRKTIALIDGQQVTLLHAVGVGGGDAGYYVQWYHLGWLYTWGNMQTQDDISPLLASINVIVKRFEHDTPVPGVASGELDFSIQSGSTGDAVWNANGTYYTASAPNESVPDFIQNLRPVELTVH